VTRAKTKGTGSRSGRRKLPDDLTDAAEAALDDLLRVDDDDDDGALEAFGDRTGTMPIDALDDDGLDGEEVNTELPVLRVAVFEDAMHLRSAQSAIGASGHSIAVAGSGADGKQQVLAAVRAGGRAGEHGGR
jgi:hypothetical protein